MAVRLLLVVEDAEARQRYEAALEGLDVVCDTVARVGEIKPRLQDTGYNGILLDVPTLIRAGQSERAVVGAVLEHFPVLRLRYDAITDTVRGLYYGQTSQSATVIRDFIDVEALSFPARTLRLNGRIEVVFNVLLAADPSMDAATCERAMTMNVSHGGCFIVTSRSWADSDKAWMMVLELDDQTPIPVEVRWRVPWGRGMRFPGLGVAFLSLTPAQKDKLRGFL